MPYYETKADALTACLILWECIAEHGYKTKIDAYQHLGFKEANDINGCPACEYDEQHYKEGRCNNCPIWPIDEVGTQFGCETLASSPYKKWMIQRDSESAKGMVELVKEKLNELT